MPDDPSPLPHLLPNDTPASQDPPPTKKSPSSSPVQATVPLRDRPSQLAELLAETTKELETLKVAHAEALKRADRAERTLATIQSTSSDDLHQRLIQLDQKYHESEGARSEEAKKRETMMDWWKQVREYMTGLELHAKEARNAFDRALDQGNFTGAEPLAFLTIPTMSPPRAYSPVAVRADRERNKYNLSSRSFPPLPSLPNSSGRRPRSDSFDGYSAHPSKRQRGMYGYPPPSSSSRLIDRDPLSDAHHPTIYLDQPQVTPFPSSSRPSSRRAAGPLTRRSQSPESGPSSRGRTRSRSQSLDVEEELLAATAGDRDDAMERGKPINGSNSGAGAPHPQQGPGPSRHRADTYDGPLSRPPHPSGPGQSQSQGSSYNPYPPSNRYPPLPDSPPYRQTHHHSPRPHPSTIPGPPPENVGGGGGASIGGRPRAHTDSAQRSHSHHSLPHGHPHQVHHTHPLGPGHSSLAYIPTHDPRHDIPSNIGGTGSTNVQTYQTHVFAPPVTGAPVKKSKFSAASAAAAAAAAQAQAQAGGGGPGAGVEPGTTDPVTGQTAAFPPVNAEGQRICRQCGQAGRYKDGKCVEKWGPGPMGPGTVCDRCRKKMKRVERRGTLESQASAASLPLISTGGSGHLPLHTPFMHPSHSHSHLHHPLHHQQHPHQHPHPQAHLRDHPLGHSNPIDRPGGPGGPPPLPGPLGSNSGQQTHRDIAQQRHHQQHQHTHQERERERDRDRERDRENRDRERERDRALHRNDTLPATPTGPGRGPFGAYADHSHAHGFGPGPGSTSSRGGMSSRIIERPGASVNTRRSPQSPSEGGDGDDTHMKYPLSNSGGSRPTAATNTGGPNGNLTVNASPSKGPSRAGSAPAPVAGMDKPSSRSSANVNAATPRGSSPLPPSHSHGGADRGRSGSGSVDSLSSSSMASGRNIGHRRGQSSMDVDGDDGEEEGDELEPDDVDGDVEADGSASLEVASHTSRTSRISRLSQDTHGRAGGRRENGDPDPDVEMSNPDGEQDQDPESDFEAAVNASEANRSGSAGAGTKKDSVERDLD